MTNIVEKLFEYKRIGFKMAIYPNRIAIEDRSQKSGLFYPDKIDILIKDITGINIVGWKRRLQLTMRDGTFREIPVPYPASEKARDILLSLL